MAKVDLGGVWRTVGGRRIFIKDGENLETAMKKSGKFTNKKMTKEEMAEKSVEIKNQRQELRDKLYKDSNNLSEKEKENLKKQIDELTKQKKELDKNLTDDDLKEARHRIEDRKIKKIDYEEEDKKVNILKKEFNKNLDNEIEKELKNIEKYENDFGIDESEIDYDNIATYKKINTLYENGEISDYVYENYVAEINEKIANYMDKKGYELYEHKGKMYYSMIPKAKESYNNVINELDDMGINYKISKSWNPGELPSIYIQNENGEQFRIANHFNNKNQQFTAYSINENKIYNTKDYVNYKETILKDLKKFLKK